MSETNHVMLLDTCHNCECEYARCIYCTLLKTETPSPDCQNTQCQCHQEGVLPDTSQLLCPGYRDSE
jgi:hypothetical protein